MFGGSGMNLITIIIGFGMSATFIVFVCTRLICGRLRRIESGEMFEIDSRIDLQMPERRANGLQPGVVAAIPKLMFNREAFSSTEDMQCTICLAEYQEREVLRIMPNCGHSFHLSCIDIWLRKQSTCPVCRLSVQNTFETKHVRATTLAESQSFVSSEIMAEHSQQWLLPTLEHSGGNRGTSHGNADHTSIDLNLGVSSAAMPRS
ncbi:RING-H2 finger ATL67-like [Olea europaea subsp. europaea]|uniref:RING-H2 finger ATL67-like n=1 Tax=Olea europaea subsp. europaea TaxID=158383 RepID=A0A8S0UET4_OLEEU|nr:RING-H2 finger ATL67-like [Olea europaea subsp. europaea]